MSRIDDCIKEYREWSSGLGITSSSDVRRIVEQGGTDWLINVSETWHEQKISEIAKKLQNNIGSKRIVLISGPSSSGKTTFASRLKLHLEVLGIQSLPISLDNYYKSFSEMPLNSEGKPDLESLESIDYEQFGANVRDLIAGKEVLLPIYEFGTPDRAQKAIRAQLAADEIIIVEGIHGLNPKLTENIPGENKYRIYCSALMALFRSDGVRIKSRSNRLIRRIIRDYYFRSSPCALTMELWPYVEAGSEKNVFPYTDTSDIIFNSSLLYELGVYKKYLHEIVGDPSEYGSNCNALKELYGIVDDFPEISVDNAPKISLVREFVGGNTLYGPEPVKPSGKG